jgi:hypothetical protein
MSKYRENVQDKAEKGKRKANGRQEIIKICKRVKKVKR